MDWKSKRIRDKISRINKEAEDFIGVEDMLAIEDGRLQEDHLFVTDVVKKGIELLNTHILIHMTKGKEMLQE